MCELDLCQHRDSIERVLCPGPVYQEVNARKSRARRLRPGGDPQEVRAGRGALGDRTFGGSRSRSSGQSIYPIHRRRSHAQKLKLPQGVVRGRPGPALSAVRGRRVYSQHGRPCTCPRSAQACLPFHHAVSFHPSLFTYCNVGGACNCVVGELALMQCLHMAGILMAL